MWWQVRLLRRLQREQVHEMQGSHSHLRRTRWMQSLLRSVDEPKRRMAPLFLSRPRRRRKRLHLQGLSAIDSRMQDLWILDEGATEQVKCEDWMGPSALSSRAQLHLNIATRETRMDCLHLGRQCPCYQLWGIRKGIGIGPCSRDWGALLQPIDSRMCLMP